FSDSLICLASTSLQSGIWLPVLEEAFGEVTHTKKKAPVPGQPAIDKIGAGGFQSTSISLLTGRHAFDHSVKTLAPARIHQLLSEAQARHYLMGASTPSGKDRKLPKGIASNHAYAVLSVQG
ncbi:C2 family cysteine protease, partial [Salmonella enterica]|uniref:C2 family cysteine protease n=1 Tax=Salmonella enterica TaxID=28901 RepID=UPI00352314AA